MINNKLLTTAIEKGITVKLLPNLEVMSAENFLRSRKQQTITRIPVDH